jgi:hypothetical protein
MKRDKKHGLFVAMVPSYLLFPEKWDSPYMEAVPDVDVGQVYSKDRKGGAGHLGKIIEAHVVEPHSVTWRTGDRPRGKKQRQDRARQRGAQPKPIHGKLAIELP